MVRHLPPARVGICLSANRAEKHLERRDAEGQAQRAVTIVREEPIVTRSQRETGRHLNRFVPCRANLKVALALILELYFLVIQATREQHRAVEAMPFPA